MEDILEVYQRTYGKDEVLVCMDETSKQQVKETRIPLAPKVGNLGKFDYEYERNGVSPENSQIMHDLACLLIPQEIFPQSLVITDTRLLREFPCENNILRDIRANL
ncbi:MAG: hypothetical protein GY815_09900 [Gammaproteobacteria bacterium]|nr:hypothetical protein [Gammaproteobacteria bacterium]